MSRRHAWSKSRAHVRSWLGRLDGMTVALLVTLDALGDYCPEDLCVGLQDPVEVLLSKLGLTGRQRRTGRGYLRGAFEAGALRVEDGHVRVMTPVQVALPTDAGALPTDAGALPTDAGALPTDAGASRTAKLVPQVLETIEAACTVLSETRSLTTDENTRERAGEAQAAEEPQPLASLARRAVVAGYEAARGFPPGDTHKVVNALVTWASQLPDPERMVQQAVTGFFADPYAQRERYSLALFAHDVPRYVLASQPPAAVVVYRCLLERDGDRAVEDTAHERQRFASMLERFDVVDLRKQRDGTWLKRPVKVHGPALEVPCAEAS